MRIKQFLYSQLAVGAWRRPGISPVNTAVVVLIVLNLALLILDTEPEVRSRFGGVLDAAEQLLLWLFTLEYVARVWTAGCNPRYAGFVGRLRYMVSFYALIDLIAILPGYLAIETSSMRALRLVRIAKFARFGAFSSALRMLAEVLRSRVYELSVSFGIALLLLLCASTLMYLVEAEANPGAFGSIPRALWWSVITMTTVGYGDATPVTPLGKMLAGIVAVIAVAIIAIPTGILAAAFSEVVQNRKRQRPPRA